MLLGQLGMLFQSAPPARAATWVHLELRQVARVWFQSAPPARAATSQPSPGGSGVHEFQSAPPARAATNGPGGPGPRRPRFNPRRPRGRRLGAPAAFGGFFAGVSIRAARAGGDTERGSRYSFIGCVSIRAARAGGDSSFRSLFPRSQVSIRAAPRGRRRRVRQRRAPPLGFNPRRPRGRRRGLLRCRMPRATGFNPRRPHGRRLAERFPLWSVNSFQSAPPARAATPPAA